VAPKKKNCANYAKSPSLPIFYSVKITNIFRVEENGAIKVVLKLALIVLRPLVTLGLHFKNYLLWLCPLHYSPKSQIAPVSSLYNYPRSNVTGNNI
jgi:hypothetical protein